MSYFQGGIMKKMSKKGITIIELVVVIIILILLAIIAIFNTNKPWLKSKAMAYNEEFKALYSSLTNLQTLYNTGIVDLEQGEYFYASTRISGDMWYTLYGQNYIQTSFDTDFIKTNEKIIKNLGLSTLKLSYQFKLRDEKNNKDDIQIRLLGDDYIELKGYKIRTYEQMKELLDSGAI